MSPEYWTFMKQWQHHKILLKGVKSEWKTANAEAKLPPCAEFLGYKSNCLMINFGETILLKEKEGING